MEGILPFGIGDEEVDSPEWRYWKARQNAWNAWERRLNDLPQDVYEAIVGSL
jgi:hypothetical protein